MNPLWVVKAIYAEKAMAASMAEADSMVEACERKNNGKIVVYYHLDTGDDCCTSYRRSAISYRTWCHADSSYIGKRWLHNLYRSYPI
ncbi:TPA: hypothetical protein EYO77_06385 [Candidatus Poribacteria bacterium]|nr:hypothetical protein [Candidatus Poribacteria bacterium]